MDFYLVLVVDISQDVVSGNGVTAVLELILSDSFLANVDGFFAVELLRHGKQFLLFLLRRSFLLATSEEGHEFAPAFLAGILAQQFVEVFLTQQDGFLAHCLIELLAGVHLMERRQLVNDVQRAFYLVLLQEFLQQLLAFLLYLATVAAQDSLNLCLCLCRRYKIDPCRLYVLRLGGQNLYLVTAFQLMTQRHQFVVHLGTDAVRA